MENFKKIFRNYSEYPDEELCLEFEGDFKGIDLNINDVNIDGYIYQEAYLNYINELKKVILKDFERVLKYLLPQYNNHEKLCFEIERLLNTYSKLLIDREEENYIILTDSYLCFTNLEEVADLDFYLKNTIKTTVIVSRNFKEFYFIIEKTNVLKCKTKTKIKHFLVKDHHIINNKIKIKGEFPLFIRPLCDCPNQDLQQAIDRIHLQYQKKK